MYPTASVCQEPGAAQLGAPGPGSLMGSQPSWWPGLQSRLGSTRAGSAPDTLTCLLETSVLPAWPLRWLPVAPVPPRASDSGEHGSLSAAGTSRDPGGGGGRHDRAVRRACRASSRSAEVACFNEGRTLHQLKVMICFIVILALSRWSGTGPAEAPGSACAGSREDTG